MFEAVYPARNSVQPARPGGYTAVIAAGVGAHGTSAPGMEMDGLIQYLAILTAPGATSSPGHCGQMLLTGDCLTTSLTEDPPPDNNGRC